MNNIHHYISLLNEQADGLLLTSRYSRMYGACFDIAEGVALVSAKGARYFTDSRYIESAQNGIRDFEVIMTDREHSYSQLLNEAIRDFGITCLGYEENYLTVAELMHYEKTLQASLTPMNAAISALRHVKQPWELERMRKAQQITDESFTQILGKIRVGMTERQLQAELIHCLLKNGADGMAFSPIIVSGPNTSLPHGVAGDRQIRDGDFVTMDFGAFYDGYCSDMTRTVAVGHVTEEMEKVYNTVLKAQLAGLAATRPGVTGRQIDQAARDVIVQAGYGAFFGHGYGHSLGMEIHEEPNCNPNGVTVMQPGMVCSAEPGIYLPGKFGVRIEDVVVFTETGCQNLTQSPKNLIIV